MTIAHATEAMFRGEEHEIEWTHEGDGIFEWWFADLSPEAHDALEITDAEDEAIRTHIYGIWSEPYEPDYRD